MLAIYRWGPQGTVRAAAEALDVILHRLLIVSKHGVDRIGSGADSRELAGELRCFRLAGDVQGGRLHVFASRSNLASTLVSNF